MIRFCCCWYFKGRGCLKLTKNPDSAVNSGECCKIVLYSPVLIPEPDNLKFTRKLIGMYLTFDLDTSDRHRGLMNPDHGHRSFFLEKSMLG